MKRKFTFLITAMALMIAIIGSSAEAWGQTTVTFTAGTDVSNTTTLTKDGITLTASTFSNINYYQTYASSDFTVTSAVGNITNVAINCTASGTNKYGPGNYSLKSGSTGEYTYSEAVGTWTGDASTFTLSASKQVRMTSVVVTYTSSGGPSISCSDIIDVPYEGITDAEAEVTFNNADGWTPSVTCDGTIVTGASLSENTVTYSVSENTGSEDRTGNFTITLSKEGEDDVEKVVSVTQLHHVVDYATLPFSYDGGKEDLPDGLTQSGLGSDYASSPKMKFDNTGDYVILKINENPGTLRYNIKGNGFSGGTFTLQTSVDGETYTDKKAYTTLGDTQTETITDLDASVRYIKWIYTTKSSGNVALGAISLAKEGVKIPTFSIPAGNYYESQSVTLSQADNKAIYYITDEGDPTTAGTLYSEAISVNSTCTIKAAAKDGEEWSEVVSATYKIAQTYNSVEAVNAITEDDIPIIISMSNWTITSISGYNMYVNDGTTGDPTPTIHIYDYQIPSSYIEDGTLSGSLKAVWDSEYTEVKTIQNWSDMSYSNPKYAINIDGEMQNGTITSDPSTEAEVGVTVTLTVTPASGYRMVANSLEILDEESEDVDYSGTNPYTFTMPASAVEISAEFEEIPTTTYSYMYSVNGIDGSETEVAEGTVITLAPGEDLNDDFKFAGWTIDETDVENLLEAGEGYEMNDDAIFYAVYSNTVGAVAGSGSFEKVTTNLTDWTGKYLLVYETNNVAWTGVDAGKCHTAVTIVNDVIATKPTDAVVLSINQMTGGYSIMIDGGTNDGKYIGKTAYSNGMDFDDSPMLNTMEYNEGNVVITAEGGCTMRYNASSGSSNERFRYYKSGQQAIQLYKKDEGTPGTTSYYTRVFLNETASSDITIVGPAIIPAGSTLDMDSYALSNETAANLVIEDGAQLILNNAGVQATAKKHIEKSVINSKESNTTWYSISSPLAANVEFTNVTNLIPNGVTDTDYDLYRINEAEGMWENSRVFDSDETTIIANPDFTTIDKGRGYIYANTSTTTDIAFAGEINVDDVEMSVTVGDGNGYNLIGNPFMQNIKLTDVEAGTATLASGFYVLNHNNSWGTKIESGTVAPLQGFLVQATTSGDVTISKPEATSKGERSDEQNANIEIIVANSNYSDNAYAMFSDGIGLNKINHRNAEAPMVYIPQDGADFAVAMMDESVTVFPASFKAKTTGYYTISLKSSQIYEGLNDFDYLHLIDNMTGEEIDMLLEDGYRFVGSPADNTNRFTVKLHRNGVEENEVEDVNFVYQNGKSLVISGEGTFQVIDMLGRIVISKEVHGETVSVDNLITGAYIVRMIGNEVKTQKIIVR